MTPELNQVLEQHKIWIESAGKHGQRANLEYANLTGASLKGANLRDANLTRANLARADLAGANLTRADLRFANLTDANLTDANLAGAYLWDAYLRGANLNRANLTNTILLDISWIKAGCLVQLNRINCSFYLKKENKFENFIQDSLGFFIQNNPTEETFDMLAGDRIIRSIPDWVKYTGLKQIPKNNEG